MVVALKDLAKEGIVAGYLLGKSLGGGGGGEVTEINTKLAGTWTSPHLSGANMGEEYIIDFEELFADIDDFNPNVKQDIVLIYTFTYCGEEWLTGCQLQMMYGNSSINSPSNNTDTMVRLTYLPEIGLSAPIRIFSDPAIDISIWQDSYNATTQNEHDNVYVPLEKGYYVFTIDIYYHNVVQG